MKTLLKNWVFATGESADCLKDGAPVSVPHTWSVDESLQGYVGKGWYRTGLRSDSSYERIFLRFRGAYRDAAVYVENQLAGKHEGSGYTPFEVEITPFINPDGETEITVSVDNSFSNNALPYSRSFDSCAEAVEYLDYDGLSELPFPFYVSSVSVSASGERSYGFLPPQFSGSQDECEVYGMDICVLSQYDIMNAETGFIFASESVRILTDANERHAADSVRVYDSFAVGRDKDDPNSYNIILQSDDERLSGQTFYEYKAQCGEICRIAISHFGAAEPNDSISCYIVHGGMLFDLNLTYYKKDAERALDAMLEWVDSFN